MVGLVIVSHSRELANALVKLGKAGCISKMSRLPLSAGVGENRQEFGTDAVEISEAILSVNSPDGVLVLMDLGSAVLSAQMALEFLEPEMAAQVRFCCCSIGRRQYCRCRSNWLGQRPRYGLPGSQASLAPKTGTNWRSTR